MTVSQTFLVSDDLDSFEEAWCSVKRPSTGIYLRFWVFFSYDQTGVTGLGEENSQCHSHQISSRAYSINMILFTVDVNLDHLAKVVFFQVSPL